MRSVFACALLIVLLAGPAAAQPIRDHRGPGEAAQWTVGAGVVGSLDFHRLYNTERQEDLGGSASSPSWGGDTRPGMGRVFFDNCTRPGEVIYGSDLVAWRFGGDFVTFGTGLRALQSSGDSYPDGVGDFSACEFRLIPSEYGLVSAGSGNGKFALYSTRGNSYLVYQDLGLFWDAGLLVWQETSSGQPPGGVAARADFVPVDLFFTSPSTAYLTIKNIGNVASSASQNEMQVRINGQTRTFVITRPIPPGGSQRNPLRFDGPLCDQVPVVLDTNPRLKFQVLRGAFPNDDVFANDRKTMSAWFTGSAAPPGRPGSYEIYLPCTGYLVIAR